MDSCGPIRHRSMESLGGHCSLKKESDESTREIKVPFALLWCSSPWTLYMTEGEVAGKKQNQHLVSSDVDRRDFCLAVDHSTSPCPLPGDCRFHFPFPRIYKESASTARLFRGHAMDHVTMVDQSLLRPGDCRHRLRRHSERYEAH